MRDLQSNRWSTRAWGLLIGSMACITRGVLYLPPVASGKEPLPLGVETLTTLVPSELGAVSWQPVWLFGALWLGIGVAGLVDVVRNRRGDRVFFAMVMMMVFWSVGFIGSTVFLGEPSGWGAGVFYLVLAAFINLFRRMRPQVRATPDLIAGRIRVDNDIVYYLFDGEWVEIYPEVEP